MRTLWSHGEYPSRNDLGGGVTRGVSSSDFGVSRYFGGATVVQRSKGVRIGQGGSLSLHWEDGTTREIAVCDDAASDLVCFDVEIWPILYSDGLRHAHIYRLLTPLL